MIDETVVPEMSAEETQLEAEITSAVVAEKPAAVEPAKVPAAEPEPRTVPIQALDEARHKYREVSDQLRQESEKRAKMEARFEEMMKRLQSPPREAPEYEKDPLGNLKHEVTEFKEWKQTQSQREAEEAKRREAEAQENEFKAKYQAAASDYMRANKDFPAAYTHLLDSWRGELAELGFSPQEVAQQMAYWEYGIAQKALADGANPAERIMKAAKVRGYKQIVPNANQQIETLKRGAQAAKSLSAAGGEVEPPTTLEALAELDGKDFDEMFEKLVNGGKSRSIWQ